MKRFLVIETATDDSWAWVYEVTREFTPLDGDKGVAYYRNPSHQAMFFDLPSPEFYGKLDALLVTRGKVEVAQPIVPTAPPPTGTIAEQIAAVDRATVTVYNEPQPEGLDMVPEDMVLERVEEWMAGPVRDEERP